MGSERHVDTACAPSVEQLGYRGRVIEMTMRRDDQGGNEAPRIQEGKYSPRFCSGIYENAREAFHDYVRILCNGSYREPLEHGSLIIIFRARGTQAVLFPLYAAFAAAMLFYLLIPIAGAFMLRNQWRRFRERVILLTRSRTLRYGDLATAEREGRATVGRFRLYGTIEAIEGLDRIWVRGKDVSALVDLSRAPLYVASPALPDDQAAPGSIERIRYRSVSSLVEGTSIFVAGLLTIDEGRPVFVDAPDESLVAVCHDDGDAKLVSRLVAGGRAQNEYWNYPTRISLALGLAVSSGIMLLLSNSLFPTLRALIFLAGAAPVLPFAPPGLALFFAYRRLWRRALEARTLRDLLRLPLRFSGKRRSLLEGEAPPINATWIGMGESGTDSRESRTLTLFSPEESGDDGAQTFVVEGDPETLARRVERRASLYAVTAGLCFGLAIIVNFVLAYAVWRWVL